MCPGHSVPRVQSPSSSFAPPTARADFHSFVCAMVVVVKGRLVGAVAAGFESAKSHTRKRRKSVKAALQRMSSGDKAVVVMATLTTSQTEEAPVVMAKTLEVIRRPSALQPGSSTELQSIELQPVPDESDYYVTAERKVRDIMTKQVDESTKRFILATCAWGELTWAQRLVHCNEVIEKGPPFTLPDAPPPITITRKDSQDGSCNFDGCCACMEDDDCADLIARWLTALCFSAILVPLCVGCVYLFLWGRTVGFPPQLPSPPMAPPYLDEVPMPPFPPTAPAPPFAPGEHPDERASAGRGVGWWILRVIICGIGYAGSFVTFVSEGCVIAMAIGLLSDD